MSMYGNYTSDFFMISDLSQKVQVISVVVDPDFGFGEPGAEVVTVLFSTWAAIKEISRKDAVAQSLDSETIQYRMRIRYTPTRLIDKDNFIAWNGKRYKPRTSPSVIEIDKRKFLETIIVRQDG